MKIGYAAARPAEFEVDLLILPFYEGPEASPALRDVGRALGADLGELLSANAVRGRVGEAFAIPTFGRIPAGTVLAVGLGARSDVNSDRVRRAAGKVAPRAHGYRRVATALPQGARGAWQEALAAAVEGLLLGGYRFTAYKADGEARRLEQVTVLGSPRWDARAARRAIERGEILAEAASWARDLVNTPAIDATPEYLAAQARAMAREVGLKVKIWSKAELERGGFGGILGVGRGSSNTPRMIELEYSGGTGRPVALSGKGVTFDSGGLSLKDAKNMEWMKSDMAGAAAVLGAMRGIARLKPKVNVIAAVPTAENLPGGSAIRPGDVLRHRGGKTSEVLNTDAEGRLILADALAYLAERNPAAIVDTATLTGACMVALGEDLWGVMGNDDGVIRDLLAAGDEVGEPGWELPLWGSYRRKIDSDVADVKNIGDRYGGAITAALFLEEFVGETPWAHMDVAGTAFAQKPGDYWPKGATGSPVRTLVRFVERRAAPPRRRTSRNGS